MYGYKIDPAFYKGEHIWIDAVSDREFDVALGARVIAKEGKRIQVLSVAR